MGNFEDTLTGQITGHLTIHKREKNGEEELLFDDHNVIVSGMSVGLSMFFTGSGSSKITDYHIDRFQVGVSGPPGDWGGRGEGDVSTISELSGVITDESAYRGFGGSIYTAKNYRITGTGAYQDHNIFGMIPFSKVTRVDDTSVRYTVVLDEGALNGLTSDHTALGESDLVNISEIGLFMGNPTGNTSKDASILVAYKSFTGIRKTDDFALVYRWTINF